MSKPTLYFQSSKNMEVYAKSICGTELTKEASALPCACGQSYGIRIFDDFGEEIQRLIHCEACHDSAPFMEQGD